MSFLQTSKLVHHPQGIWAAFRYCGGFFPSCLLFYHLSSQCESFCIEVSSYGEDQFTVQSKTSEAASYF